MKKYIGYIRVSTIKQNDCLVVQKNIIEGYINSSNGELIDIVINEDSKNNKILNSLIDKCINNDYTLLFSHWDRLSRDLNFIINLINNGVKLYCITSPQFNYGMFNDINIWESDLVSKRTKIGLSNAKKRGVKLGSPQNLTMEAKRRGTQMIKQSRMECEVWKEAHLFIKDFISKNGGINFTEISRELNNNGYRTRRGYRFTATTVRRLINFNN